MKDLLTLEYQGLFGEVVECDAYGLHSLPFQPDLIFDVGSNIGIFAWHARQCFPQARIVCVEPHLPNRQRFAELIKDRLNLTLVERALGSGQIYHGLTSANGSGETYLSVGLGYPESGLESAVEKGRMEVVGVEGISLFQLWEDHYRAGEKVLLKLDCEGAENSIFNDPISMSALIGMDAIAAEIHTYGITHQDHTEVEDRISQVKEKLIETHICRSEGVHFWAIKKEWYGNSISESSLETA